MTSRRSQPGQPGQPGGPGQPGSHKQINPYAGPGIWPFVIAGALFVGMWVAVALT